MIVGVVCEVGCKFIREEVNDERQEAGRQDKACVDHPEADRD